MEKVLTVVVPTYNMEKYLDRCLTSLIVDEERMSLLEVLVVNDGSKDRSSEIAHGYESRYPDTFRVIDKENGNYGSCINAALPESKGKYIKILDADDYFENPSIPLLIDNLVDHEDYDMIITNIRYVDGEGRTCSQLSFGLPDARPFDIVSLDDDTICKLHMHAIAYRTSLLVESSYNQTEGISYTDLEWTYYPMANVTSIKYFNFNLYVYNTYREGQTTSNKKHCRDMWMESGLILKMLERYKEKGGYAGGMQSEYMKNKLLSYMRQMYSYYLLSFPHSLKQSDIKAFDNSISSCPALYEELDGFAVNVNRMGSVFFIKEWRKRFSRCSHFFFKYDLQEFVSKLYHKIK